MRENILSQENFFRNLLHPGKPVKEGNALKSDSKYLRNDSIVLCSMSLFLWHNY